MVTSAQRTVNFPEGPPIPRVLGHYEILEKIGQGGMAVVYKGLQPSLNRPVAVKILPPQFTGSPELLGRFEREAAIVSQLNHSNIVQVIDRGREGDLLYIVMEYVDGESLEKIIRSRRLELAEIVDWAIQICDALEYAHSVGVIHRDLKPSNILIEQRTKRVKIADFGIAQLETNSGVLATLTYDHTSLGTMNYMSPEQRVDAHRVTHLTDIFSFGVILYEMMTGKLPLGHFKLPSLLRSDIPLGFDAIVKKCLSESPSDRYGSAGEVRDELMRLTTRRIRPGLRPAGLLSRFSHRQRWGLAAGMVCVLVLGVIASVKLLVPPLLNRSRGATDGQGGMVGEAGIRADFARAQGFLSQGKYADAISILNSLLAAHAKHPLAPEIRFTLASALYDAGEKEKCKLEYDRFLRNYPLSPRAPEAEVARCRAEWETAPHRRTLLKGPVWDAALQQRLGSELSDLLQRKPTGPHVVPALGLLASIAEAPAWTNLELAASSLVRLSESQPGGNVDALFRAAELYDQKLKRPEEATKLYERFLESAPGDRRASRAKSRLARLASPKKGESR